jgi:hypothetical protein
MAMRSRTTFKKRQKELARQEKQRDKVARRLQRKLEKNSPDGGDGLAEDGDDILDAEGVEPQGAEDNLEPVAPSAGNDTHESR